MLFSGKDNAIFFSREYYQDYGCSFDLRFYPFDTQMCEMIFEIQGKTDNYVRFIKDGEGIEFRSKDISSSFGTIKNLWFFQPTKNLWSMKFKWLHSSPPQNKTSVEPWPE